MKDQTKTTLDQWRASGLIDETLYNSMMANAVKNPAFDAQIASGILNGSQFTGLRDSVIDANKKLIADVAKYAELKAMLPLLEGKDDEIAKARLEMDKLETSMKTHPDMAQAAPSDFADINLIMAQQFKTDFETKMAADIANSNTPANLNSNPNTINKGDDMNKDAVTLLVAEGAFGSMGIQDQKNAMLRDAEATLGRSLTGQEVLEVSNAVNLGIRNNKTVAQVFDEHFKLAEARTTNAAIAREAELEAVRVSTRAEVEKELALNPDRRRDMNNKGNDGAKFVTKLQERLASAVPDETTGLVPAYKLYNQRGGEEARQRRNDRVQRATAALYNRQTATT